MAEFEELRLTVNLVDAASSGLQKIRGEIGQLTQSASAMTTGMVEATAGLKDFASGINNAQPKTRSLNAEMRDLQRHAAETGRAVSQMGMAVQQGFSGLPTIALGLYDAAGGAKGLGEAMKSLTPVARISTQALIGVGIGVVAVGAAVVAYGVSVFRLAKDMDQLNRTARTMGMSFAELKNAQDQAKAFGGSAEMMVRTFQGVQAAQLDLYKSNSELRQKLVSKGVEANWVDALGAMDPTEFTNAAVKYAKSLEQQWLASGAIPSVARAQANKFLQEFGIAINLMDMPELKPPTEAAKREADQLAKLSKDVMDIWNPMTVKMEKIKLEALKAGLPLLKQFLDFADEHIDSIKSGIQEIGRELKSIATLYQAATKPGDYQGWWADALFGKKGESSMRDALEWLAKKIGNSSEPGMGGQEFSSGDMLPEFQQGTSAPVLPSQLQPPSPLQPDEVKKSIQDRFKKFGANDNVSGTRVGFMTQDLADKTELNTGQMEKLTEQLEKLNSFYERAEAKGGGGGFGGGGASGSWGSGPPAAASASGGGGPAGGGGSGAGGGDGSSGSGGGTASGTSSGDSVDAGQVFGNKPVTVPGSNVIQGAEGGGGNAPPPGAAAALVEARAHLGEHEIRNNGALKAFMASRGIKVNPATTPWCAAFVNATLKGQGIKGTDSLAASSFTKYGTPVAGKDVQQGDIGVVKGISPRTKQEGKHVGLLTGNSKMENGRLMVEMVGGNQGSDNVSKDWYPADKLHLRRAPAPAEGSTGTIADRPRTGGYSTQLFSPRETQRKPIGLDLLDRGELDRAALNDNTTIDAKGTVKVQVGGKTASEKSAKRSELFKNGSMTTMEQMPHTATNSHGSPTVDETAKDYMATR